MIGKHAEAPGTTTQTLHLVRHAQGFHNLAAANHHIPDPLLTEYGKEQCLHLHNTFPHMSSVDLVVASPLRRTLYTALYSFKDAIATKELKVVALPEIQETSDWPCDTGTDVSELEREFAGQPVDLSLVTACPDWNSKRGDWAPWRDPTNARAKKARQWLRNRPERNIVIVTHGGFLHYFTEDFDGHDAFYGTGWANTEFRTYTFDAEKSEHASVVETTRSRQRRYGTEKPLSEAERRNLNKSAERNRDLDSVPKSNGPPIHIQSKFKARQRDFVGGFNL